MPIEPVGESWGIGDDLGKVKTSVLEPRCRLWIWQIHGQVCDRVGSEGILRSS